MKGAVKLAKRFYLDEWADAMLYKKLAEWEKDERIKREFERLAELENWHAEFWRTFLEKRNERPQNPE